MARAKIAFIGGSGLYDMDGLEEAEEVRVETPFGDPSDSIIVGTLNGTQVAFLPRHGRGHRFSPTEIPFKANIYALKMLGVERIVSVSAVGSLKEEIRPLDLVIPDQIIDHTKGRPSTFFEKGIVAHVGFADPFCDELRNAAVGAAQQQPVGTHTSGTMMVIEGPQFSTRAESELYRAWGGSVIGMTALPEAKLAREAEICYVTLALVTDYDCWHHAEEDVSVELVVANLRKSVANSQQVIRALTGAVPPTRRCSCGTALRDSIITAPERIADETTDRLSAIIDKYVGAREATAR